ncbi:MAG: transketolase [Flammeovirgaceae bacterium]|nr:transketolase [Flammeovirgaceae bacterium]MBE63289.1 transketolase [Flammeovirgaceae bacterium]MBR07780.1 transketolase [Rickettsiales bacterium]|tara:strand:+ start:9006 stop:11411 length:2406 start_codon:yes stop_codon:yes gene_type:complete
MSATKTKKKTSLNTSEILHDYALAVESRENSLIGRKEVFMGKAKFGIFGDGKEVAQIAKAKFFQNGDWRSGYYRDQTFMMALGQLTSQQFFAQLYAHTDVDAEPASAGRMMNGHFGTRSLNSKGEWRTLTDMKNSSSDISCTAGQMPRLIGLGWASKLYRENPALQEFKDFSINGNEVAFGTIGNASTSEGHFLEAMNAAGVLQIPMVMSVWDDFYGISVPQQYHTTKESISEALSGMQRSADKKGFEIFKVNGWDYAALLNTYEKAVKLAREEHVPCLVHVEEVTQPQGHSTSGSHERYKSKERLDWEKEHDCILKMRQWITTEGIASAEELDKLEKEAKSKSKKARDNAWKAYNSEIKDDLEQALELISKAALTSDNNKAVQQIKNDLKSTLNPFKADIIKAVRKSFRHLTTTESAEKARLIEWYQEKLGKYQDEYSSHLYSESDESALKVEEVKAEYNTESKLVDGREIVQACFDALFERDPRVIAFGEDVGKIGDVNQGFAGLQDKYGEVRITDTGIRETTIIGQGIGAALRGLRPIAEIQYLDYLLYAIQTLSDDLASLQYRMKGGQKAPLIVRSRGHRLEGVWHSGSPMGMIINSIRGMHVLVPRNMTQAAGFYNTLMASDDPAIVIESLNGYRLKEKLPENIGEFKVPLGVPEVLREGTDITLVTYGSMCRIVMEAAQQLSEIGINCEVIDVQTLLPFDRKQVILDSIKKTNRVAFLDEDVPGGASAFMMQNVLERDNGYFYLDSKPITVTAQEHRPAYGTDGDYFSKPSVEDVYEKVYQVMHEAKPDIFKKLF